MQRNIMLLLALSLMNYTVLFSMESEIEDISIEIRNKLPVKVLITITDRSNKHEFNFFGKYGKCKPECPSATWNNQTWWVIGSNDTLSFTLTDDVLNSDVFENIEFPIYLKFAADLGATIIKEKRKPVEKGDVINLDIGSQGMELYITEK